ncbi:MAG: flagellar protein FlgN [Cellulosilyticaceae bacterium]
MAGIIYDLEDVLEEQRLCYEGLCTLATYKTDAVMHKDITLLAQIVEKEEAFIGRMNYLEKKRESILKDIALVTGLHYATLTVTDLVRKMGETTEISQRLLVTRAAILAHIEHLKKQNELNTQLIQESLEYVNFTVNAIQTTQLSHMPAGYGKPGQTQAVETRSFFDSKQ